jgi:hypothetical protein
MTNTEQALTTLADIPLSPELVRAVARGSRSDGDSVLLGYALGMLEVLAAADHAGTPSGFAAETVAQIGRYRLAADELRGTRP